MRPKYGTSGYCTALREGSLTARVTSIYLGCEGERCVADRPLLAARRLLDNREAEDEVCCHAEEEHYTLHSLLSAFSTGHCSYQLLSTHSQTTCFIKIENNALHLIIQLMRIHKYITPWIQNDQHMRCMVSARNSRKKCIPHECKLQQASSNN